MSSHFTEFINLLDEIKYERRNRIYLGGVNFLILYVEPCNIILDDLQNVCFKTIMSLEKRLKSLEGVSICEPIKIAADRRCMQEICLQLNELLRRFNYGEFDVPDMLVDEQSEEYSTDEESE